LKHYLPLYATLADFHRRADQPEHARKAYQKALELAQSEPEQRFFRQRIEAL